MKKHQEISNSEIVTTDFAILADGSIAELVEDPDDAAQTLFAVCESVRTRYERQLDVSGRTLVPFQRNDEILRHIHLARGAQPYRELMELWTGIYRTFQLCIDLDDVQLFLLSYFALSTWFIDRRTHSAKAN